MKQIKTIITQIRLKENLIDKIEKSCGNYPTEEKQIELNCLYSEIRELRKKINK